MLVAGGLALLRRRPLVLGAFALLLALALAITFVVVRPRADTVDRADLPAPAPGDRVLQSVDVAMQTNGALTRIGDTVVIARSQGGAADSYTTIYDPARVVDQLPVRVVTAYRTDKGSGTDLAELKGFSGRITIDLMVQNLTVKPQQVSYDVAGRSRTTTALVGAPLTVVASAALTGVDPASVVTADADAAAATQAAATNGVLSQAPDGTTQVQWASILAPPQLDSTATLRLVVDASDFVVPAVDLSVQPGLVTDPSVGALIDSAFNPKNSSELALENRTIALVGDVNDVLGRASGTISSVRKTLDASSETLGTKTVESLTQDTKTISTSLKSSSDNIDSLGDDLTSSLEDTQSSTLQRMSETVSGLQDLIGDTSATQPKATVTGTGCDAKVKAPGANGGVYASLLAVTAQLDAYATTSDGCKAQLQAAIASSIGELDKDGKPVCVTDAAKPSVVCSLVEVRRKFEDVTASIGTSQEAAKGLDPGSLTTSLTDIDALSTQLAAVVDATDALLAKKADDDPDADPDAERAVRLEDVTDALTAAGTSLTAAGTSLGQSDTTLDALTTGVSQIHADAVTNRATVTSMVAQNAELATKLCGVVGDGVTPGTLPAAQVEALRAYLVTTSCPGAGGVTTELTPPAAYPSAMATRLDAQAKAWDVVVAATDTEDTEQGLGLLLADQRTQLAAVGTQLETLGTQLGLAGTNLSADEDSVTAAVTAVNATAKKAQTDLTDLGTTVATTQTGYVAAKEKLDAALAEAAEKSQKAASESVDPAIKQVTEQGDASSEELGLAFDASAAGITAAADALRDGSAKTLKKQQADLAAQQDGDQRSLGSETKAGLAQVSGDVNRATRDLDSTRTKLTQDLNNVLLDLGNPKTPGKGLLGTLSKSARSADSADFQLGLGSDTVSSYSAVRSEEVSGILLRQAQAEASLTRQAELPAFATDLPANIQHRTVYLMHVGGDR